MPQTVTFKKYPNRRLYCVEQSRHCTIKEVCAVVGAGASVKIVMSSNGRDITQRVLVDAVGLLLDHGKEVPISVTQLQGFIRAALSA